MFLNFASYYSKRNPTICSAALILNSVMVTPIMKKWWVKRRLLTLSANNTLTAAEDVTILSGAKHDFYTTNIAAVSKVQDSI